MCRRLIAEFLGSGFLAATVAGSGIAAQRLSPGDVGMQLFENAAATGTGLFAIILMFGPISGGQFNAVISIVDATLGGLSWTAAAAYIPTQTLGCIGGAIVANIMFGLGALTLSTKELASGPHFLGEAVATFGLVLVVFALSRTGRQRVIPSAVGSYTGAAYFFTSSTSFANPAITAGRMLTNSFAGIDPSSVLVFIAPQMVGCLAGWGVVAVLYPGKTPEVVASAEMA
jgi:glycerol uptake facilitator-like aquaporin